MSIIFDNINNRVALYFVDFKELLFNQEQIMYNIIKETKDNIIDYLAKNKNDDFQKFFEKKLSHYKINQIMINNILNTSLKTEMLEFSDFLLLITTRFSFLSKDIEDLKYQIYFLNKLNEKNNIFKSINKRIKMNSYQENYYLLLLDNNEFVFYLIEIISQIKEIIYNRMNSFKKYIFVVLLINVVIYIFVFSNLFGYFSIYLIIIFQIFQDINTFLNEKLGEHYIKDIMRKKMDNLKLILNFYDNDLNETIKDLNLLYHKYEESYSLKAKEESKFIKKDNIYVSVYGKGVDNESDNLCKLFKFKYFSIFCNYSSRKSIYLYSIVFLIIVVIIPNPQSPIPNPHPHEYINKYEFLNN